MKKLFFVIMIIFSGSWLFAEEPQSARPTQADSNSNAQAFAVYNQGDDNSISKSIPQVNMVAGPTTYVIPGNAPSGKTPKVVVVPNNRVMAKKKAKNMMKGDKGKNFSVLYQENTEKEKHDSLSFVNWNPYEMGYAGDEILAARVVLGKPWWPEQKWIAQGAEMCFQKNINASRAAILRYEVVASKTKTGVFGVSLGGGSVNKTGDVSLGTAIGFGKGNATSFPETWPVHELVCLNSNFDESGKLRINKPVVDVCDNLEGIQNSVPEGYHQEGKSCLPNVPPPPPPPPQPQEVVVKLEIPKIVVEVPPIQLVAPPPPPAVQTPPPALQPEVKLDPCAGMPQVSILFDNWKSNIRDQKERSKIEEFANWWKNGHRACRFQVRSNCSDLADDKLNDNLGMNRSKSIRAVLIELGVNPEQVVSGGKLATIEGGEYSQIDRRGIFQAVGTVELGTASGK